MLKYEKMATIRPLFSKNSIQKAEARNRPEFSDPEQSCL